MRYAAMVLREAGATVLIARRGEAVKRRDEKSAELGAKLADTYRACLAVGMSPTFCKEGQNQGDRQTRQERRVVAGEIHYLARAGRRYPFAPASAATKTR